jgi:gliding motility-associated protein GldL
MAFMYGFGAALVIIGALFKLQHWSGAGYMLSIGMFTECFIFFFSAFEPLPADYHWDNVFPQLANNNVHGEGGILPQGGAIGLPRSGVDLSIDPEDAENLKLNVARFNESINSLSALSTIGDVSNHFVNGLQQAADNMDVLNESTQSLTTAYGSTAQTLVTSGQQAANHIDMLNESAQSFADAYRNTVQTVVASGQQANDNLATLNKNLQAVNTSYELYIQEHREYVVHSQKLLHTMDNSASQSQQFDQQMIELNKLIAELNMTYTSVVSAVNTTLKKR